MVTKDHLARLGGGYDVLFLSTAVGVGLELLLPVYTAFVALPFGKLLAESIPGLDPLMAITWDPVRNSSFRLSQHALIIAGMIVAMLALASMLNLLLIVIPGADRIRTYCMRQASLRRGDLLQVVLDDSLMVELALRGGKSYMGLPVTPFSPVPGDEGSTFVRIVPIFSGYGPSPSRACPPPTVSPSSAIRSRRPTWPHAHSSPKPSRTCLQKISPSSA